MPFLDKFLDRHLRVLQAAGGRRPKAARTRSQIAPAALPLLKSKTGGGRIKPPSNGYRHRSSLVVLCRALAWRMCEGRKTLLHAYLLALSFATRLLNLRGKTEVEQGRVRRAHHRIVTQEEEGGREARGAGGKERGKEEARTPCTGTSRTRVARARTSREGTWCPTGICHGPRPVNHSLTPGHGAYKRREERSK